MSFPRDSETLTARRQQGEYIVTLTSPLDRLFTTADEEEEKTTDISSPTFTQIDSAHDSNSKQLPPLPARPRKAAEPEERVSVILSGYECCRCGVVSEVRHQFCPNCDFFLEFQCWTCGWVSQTYTRLCLECGHTMLPPIQLEEKSEDEGVGSVGGPLSLSSSSSCTSSAQSAPNTPPSSTRSLVSSRRNSLFDDLPDSSSSSSSSSSSFSSSSSSSPSSSSSCSSSISSSPTTSIPVTIVTSPPTPVTPPPPLSTTTTTTTSTTSFSSGSPPSRLRLLSQSYRSSLPTNRPRQKQYPAPPPRPPLPKTMPDFKLLVTEYADEETEHRARAITEAPVVEAASAQAEGQSRGVQVEEEGTEVSLDLSQYSSLDAMVEVLLISPTFNISFRNIFLNTLHMFTTPCYLLEHAIQIMSMNPPKLKQDLGPFQRWIAGRMKGFSVLNYWASRYPQDFDASMKDQLFAWLSSIPCPSWGAVVAPQFQDNFQGEMKKLRDVSRNCLNEAKQAFAALAWMRKSVSTADHLLRFYTSLKSWGDLKVKLKQELSAAVPLNLLAKTPRETAVQLTLMQVERMLVLHGPRALLKQSLTKLEGAPSQMNLSNAMSSWVASEVLRHNARKMQAKFFKRMVKIAAECYFLKNFATVFEIMYGLSQNSVYRLRGDKSKDQEGVFDRLTKRSRGIYDALIKFVSPVENFTGYRKVVASFANNVDGVCWTPYIGVLLKDLVTIEEGGKPFKVKVHRAEEQGTRRISLSSDPLGSGEYDAPTVYVLFNKCSAVSRQSCETLACCSAYPVRDRLNPLYATWAIDPHHAEVIENGDAPRFKSERPKKASKGGELDYSSFVHDELMQLQMLDGILNAMSVDELDRRSFEILPRKVAPR